MTIDGHGLTLAQFIAVTRGGERVILSSEAATRMRSSRAIVEEKIRQGQATYGINTGFGKLSDILIDEHDTRILQRNLILSHSCGVGKPLDEEIVRGILLLRANALAKGYSGIRVETVQLLL